MIPYAIEVQDEFGVGDDALSTLLTVADAALRQQMVAPPAGLTLLLTGSERLQQLNHQFRGEEKTTDVLSFPAGDALAGAEHYLGDVAIATPVAAQQAEAGGHTLEAELALLTVHGILHLLGHDHGNEVDKAAMWAAQEEILATLNISVTLVHLDADS